MFGIHQGVDRIGSHIHIVYLDRILVKRVDSVGYAQVVYIGNVDFDDNNYTIPSNFPYDYHYDYH
jgi:hypothetical protein